MKKKALRARIFLASSIGFMILAGIFAGSIYAIPPIQRTVLPNKLVILSSEDHSLPFVTIQVLIDSGSWRDPAGREGLAYLTAKALLLGTGKRTVNQVNEELDFIGAELKASCTRDYATLTLRVLRKDLDKGLDLFFDSLTQPSFPEEELRREVEKTLAKIQSAEDQPGEVAEKEFNKILFQENPYGHPIEGTRESLPGLKRDDFHRLYQTYYHPSNAILTVVGALTADEIKSNLFTRLEKWPAREVPKEEFKVGFSREPKTVKIDRNLTQANIILGHAGISRGNPDYYTANVMNYILGGGGFASRLTEEIRNKRGLAYSVYSYFDPGKHPGSFQIVLQTKNASAREAISLSLQQMELIRKEPVPLKELEGARKYLIGSFPMRFDTQAKRVNFLAQVEFYGLGLDYPQKYPSIIQAITPEDVLRAAQTFLHPDNTILVVVGNLKEAGME